MNMTSEEAQTAWPGGSVAGKVEEGDPQEGDPPGCPARSHRQITPPSRLALGVSVGPLSGTLFGTRETFRKYLLNE